MENLNSIACYNYEKHDRAKVNGRVTGSAVCINQSDYCVVDVDINKALPREVRREILNGFIDMFKDKDVWLVKTAHRGLHIYSLFDGDRTQFNKNAYVKAYSHKDETGTNLFDIDLFVPIIPSKRTLVVSPGSIVKVSQEVLDNQALFDDDMFRQGGYTCGEYKYVEGYGDERELKTKYSEVMDVLLGEGILIAVAECKVKDMDRILGEKCELELLNDMEGGDGEFKVETIGIDNVMDRNLFGVVVNGFNGVSIHNDSCNIHIEKEITLLPLLQAFNSLRRVLGDELIKRALTYLYNKANLTAKARENFWNKAGMSKYMEFQHHAVLIKCIKYHNPTYYNLKVIPLLIDKEDIVDGDEFAYPPKPEETPEKPKSFISLKENFGLSDIRRKAAYGDYMKKVIVIEEQEVKVKVNGKTEKRIQEVDIEQSEIDYEGFLNDMGKVLTVIDCKGIFCLKGYGEATGNSKYGIEYMSEHECERTLRTISLGKVKSDGPGRPKDITAWAAINMNNNINRFLKKGITFLAKDHDYMSVFQGYDWTLLPSVDYSIISQFLDLTKIVLSGGESNVEKYIHQWIAETIQKPGTKREVGMVFTGEEGTGKNVFGNIVSRLFGSYANPNISRIEDLIGQFNIAIENKMLVIVNELQSAEGGKMVNWDSMKTLLTDSHVYINAKGKSQRQAENVCNFMYFTNNDIPVRIGQRDRHYMIQRVSNKLVGKFDFFSELVEQSKSKEFMDNLFTHYMRMDIRGFNSRDIPETDVKLDIKEVCASPVEKFVKRNSLQFADDGITPTNAYELYKQFLQVEGGNSSNMVRTATSFGVALKKYCEQKREKHHNKVVRMYFLREEYKHFTESIEAIEYRE